LVSAGTRERVGDDFPLRAGALLKNFYDVTAGLVVIPLKKTTAFAAPRRRPATTAVAAMNDAQSAFLN